MISPEDEGKAYAVKFPEETILSIPTSDARAKISEFRFKVRYSIAAKEIAIYGEDHVSMVMHAIFENRKFAIAPSGAIRVFPEFLSRPERCN